MHRYEQNDGHGHTHGAIDPSTAMTKKGLWAVKWSFIGLMITFAVQVVVVAVTGSVALLADTIHNLGDAVTAIPLSIAFFFAMKRPSKKFTYGFGRVEDLAGAIIVILILFSAIFAGYQAIDRIIHPQTIQNIWALIIASIIGFIGNEAVAIFRIKVGKEIGSAALIVDGYHARADGFMSLAVLPGAIGVMLGFPLSDPIIGLLISVTILKIVWDSMKTVFLRLLDGVEPEYIEKIKHSLSHITEIKDVLNIKARWSGHLLSAEVHLKVDSHLSFGDVRGVIEKVQYEIKDHIKYISNVMVNVEPENYVHRH